jgi:hypothetical protein
MTQYQQTEMCTSWYIKYTCGCKKESEFEQCVARQGSNVRCHPVLKRPRKDSTIYCPRHLVKPDAPVKYYDQNDNAA